MIITMPYIAEETDDFAVVFKPPKMHSTSTEDLTQRHEEHKEKFISGTLLGWYQEQAGNITGVSLMHRLDYETHGLVLIAKNEKSFCFFKDLQDKGGFVKEYSAKVMRNEEREERKEKREKEKRRMWSEECEERSVCLNGFPAHPEILESSPCFEKPFIIESYFRPFGPGRKQVRPVIEDGKKHKEVAKDKGGFYRTEIVSLFDNIITARIKRGFRHQIRCHLYWIGFAILNDPIYFNTVESSGIDIQGTDNTEILALRAHALFFTDPASGKKRECRIEGI